MSAYAPHSVISSSPPRALYISLRYTIATPYGFTHPTPTLSRSLSPFSESNTHLQVVLETEYDNTAALSLYESLGFIREKRLYRFYLNGKDAFRLVHIVPAGRGKGGGMNLPSGGAGMDIPGSRSDDSSDTASDSSYEADRARGRRIGYPYRAIRVSEPYDSEDEVSYR